MNLRTRSHEMYALLSVKCHKGRYKRLTCISWTVWTSVVWTSDLHHNIVKICKLASPPSPPPPILWSALCLYSQHICNIRQSRAQTRGAARRLVAWLRINLTAGDNGHLSRLPRSWLSAWIFTDRHYLEIFANETHAHTGRFYKVQIFVWRQLV